MKKIILALICMVLVSTGNAQSYFQLSTAFNDTVYAAGTNNAIDFNLQVVNTATNVHQIIWKKEQNCVMPASWITLVKDRFNCYQAQQLSSPLPDTIHAGATHLYILEYSFLNPQLGAHSTRFTVYDPTDSINSTASIDVKINGGCATLSNSDKVETQTIEIYPTVCSDKLSIDNHELTISQIIIFNEVGQLVSTIPSNQVDKIQINTLDYASGIYYLKIIDKSNKVYCKKFVKD